MEEKTIKINTNIFLPDIVNAIRKGEWKIPRFQRDFVWGKKKVIELLDSIYKGFPVGSFFLWIPPEEYSKYYKDIPELEIEHNNQKYYTHFILDGQQRLTSLYVIYKGLQIDKLNYRDICFDLDSEEFNTDPKNEERNISLHQILNFEEYLDLYNNLSNERKKIFMRIREIFNKYPFPVIIIEDKNVEEACKIFERINQGGKRLGIFDLVVAATWDKDFELKKKIDDFNKNKVGSFGKIDYEVFSETISLITNKQCTKAFQLKLNSEDVKKTWPKVEKAIQGSIKFLRTDLKVKQYEYLPYRDMLALIAYYYYFQETEARIDKEFLKLWFWKAALSNRYSGSSFNKIGEDRAYIFDEIIRGENVSIDYNINIDIEKIKNVNMNRQTALRNAILIILLEQTPLSFADNSTIDIERDSISEFNKSEKHHIFPKKFLKSIGITGKKATDLVVNFCLIDSALNKSISGKRPSEYLTKFKQINPELKKSLNSHLIPQSNDSGAWEDNYNKFIEQRAKLIYTHVKKKVGDIGATIEEQISSSPELLISNTERKIREAINHVLYESLGEDWWYIEKIVPQDIRGYAKEKIKKEKAQKPYISDEEWKTPMRQLEQINIPDYCKIILKNWNIFEDIFGSKKQTEDCFARFSTIRNQINHFKTIDSTERKFGETAIEWITKCLQNNHEKEVEGKSKTKPKKAFQVNAIYEEIRRRIMELDPVIEEREGRNRKKFNKNNRNFNFVILRFSNKDILTRIIVPKGKLEDPKSITVDKTDREDKEKRRIFFNVKDLSEIDYAIELIKQAYSFNEEYIQRIRITPLRHKRHEFWNQLLLKAKEKNSSFQNLAPTPYTWIGKGAGKSGISLNLVIANKHARIEVFIDCGEKSKNKKRFDFLSQFKKSIEKSYGDTLNWQRLDSKRSSRISQTIENIGLKNEDKWGEIQYEMIDKALRLENATKDYIIQIP